MAKKLLFIVNLRSGKGQIKGYLADIINIMIQTGYDVNVYITQCQGDAIKKTIEAASQYDRIVCSGGDGTLDEVVTGMMQSPIRIPVGYIPAGSTNDFGNSLGIDKNIINATRSAVSDKLFKSDIGYFNNDIFVYVAAFGLFTEVTYQTPQDLKNVLGHMAYIIEGAKQLRDIKSYRMQVEYEGNIIQDDFILGLITNAKTVGGFKGLIQGDIDLCDGLFEVLFVKRPKNPIELNEILAFFTGVIPDSNMIYTFKASELKVTAAVDVPWTCDGEFGGNHQTVSVKNAHKALEIAIE